MALRINVEIVLITNGMKKGDQEKVFNKVAITIDGILRGKTVHKETELDVATIEEIRSEEQEKEKTSRKSRPIPEKKTTLFRSTPAPLSKSEVKAMLVERGFFASDWNPGGRGFNNDFELQKDGKVVFDRASVLMWQQSCSKDYIMVRKEAQTYIAALNSKQFAGFDDWRLPTMEEAMSLLDPAKNSDGLYINPVFDEKQPYIWTSDPYLGIFGPSASSAWVVHFYGGYCGGCSTGCVRAVR